MTVWLNNYCPTFIKYPSKEVRVKFVNFLLFKLRREKNKKKKQTKLEKKTTPFVICLHYFYLSSFIYTSKVFFPVSSVSKQWI